MCWGKSLRGCDGGLADKLKPGNQRLLISSPGLECVSAATIATLGAVLRTLTWEDKVMLWPSGSNTWLNPIRACPWTLRILVGGCRDLLLRPRMTRMCVCQFLGLLHLPPTHLAWSASSLVSPNPLSRGSSIQFPQGTPKVVKW